MVVQGHDLQRIWSGYQIPKQAHLSALLESKPRSLAQNQLQLQHLEIRGKGRRLAGSVTVVSLFGNKFDEPLLPAMAQDV